MAPGSAPVYSGCGIAGGNPDGCGKPMGPGQDCGDYKGGFSFGPRAEDYDFTDIVTTEWIRYTLGIQIRNMKMVFNFYCTWRWVTFEKLMIKIYEFFLFG